MAAAADHVGRVLSPQSPWNTARGGARSVRVVLTCPCVLMRSDAKAKKAAQAKTAKASARHNQGGNKQQYARPTARGAKGKAVTARGK